MIKRHEDITLKLTKEEKILAHNIIPFFEKRTKINQVKSKDVVIEVNNNYNLKNKFNEVRLRKIINYYRLNSIIPLMSSSNGYYVSYEQKDIDEMYESLNQRATSIQECANGLLKFNLKK